MCEILQKLEETLSKMEEDEYSTKRHVNIIPPELLIHGDDPRYYAQRTNGEGYLESFKPSLQETGHLDTLLKRTWNRLEPELKVNRLLVFAKRIANGNQTDYEKIKCKLLSLFFSGSFDRDAVVYENGNIMNIHGFTKNGEEFVFSQTQNIEHCLKRIAIVSQVVNDSETDIICKPVKTPECLNLLRTREKIEVKQRKFV